MTSPDRARRRSQSLGAFALYFAAAVLLLDRGLIRHPGYFIGRDTDPGVHMWFFTWWRFALARGLNPFITDWVWTPLGMNLAWTTCVPLPSLISIPLQVTVGEPATYNIIVTPMLPLAAFAAFLLCRRVTGDAFWPSVLGGYIFGFSPYMLGQVLAHLVLILIFPVPLIALLTLKRLDGEISALRYAIGLAVLLIVQFLCSVELFATITIVGGFALMLTRAQWFWGRTWNEEPPRPGGPGPEAAPWAAETGPAELARRFYYDSLVFDHRAIRYLIDMFGADRLLVGSDFPAMPREEPAGRTLSAMGLPAAVLDDITWHNCFRFLGVSEPEGRGADWTEERSDEGRRRLQSAPEASGKHSVSEPG